MKNLIKSSLFTIIFVALMNHVVVGSNFYITLEQAAFRATQNSRELRTLQEDERMAHRNLQFLRTQHVHFTTMTDFINNQADIMVLAATRAAHLHNANAVSDTMHFLVATHFANITAAMGELALHDANLAIMQKEQDMLQTKVDIGVASMLEYQMAQLALQNVIHNRQALVSAINQAHMELNRLIGAPQNRIHQFVFEIEYEPLVVINFAGHINHHRQNHALVVQASTNANIYRYRLNHHHVEINPLTHEPVIGQLSREELTILANQAARDLQDTRNNVEAHMIETYNQIRTLEQNIEIMQLQLLELYYDREILQSRLAVGDIIAIDIERHNLSILNMQENLRRTKTDHYLLVMQFNNPNIAF